MEQFLSSLSGELILINDNQGLEPVNVEREYNKEYDRDAGSLIDPASMATHEQVQLCGGWPTTQQRDFVSRCGGWVAMFKLCRDDGYHASILLRLLTTPAKYTTDADHRAWVLAWERRQMQLQLEDIMRNLEREHVIIDATERPERVLPGRPYGVDPDTQY